MSERMTPIGIDKILQNITTEYDAFGTVYGVKRTVA